jgi:hypothetical protein
VRLDGFATAWVSSMLSPGGACNMRDHICTRRCTDICAAPGEHRVPTRAPPSHRRPAVPAQQLSMRGADGGGSGNRKFHSATTVPYDWQMGDFVPTPNFSRGRRTSGVRGGDARASFRGEHRVSAMPTRARSFETCLWPLHGGERARRIPCPPRCSMGAHVSVALIRVQCGHASKHGRAISIFMATARWRRYCGQSPLHCGSVWRGIALGHRRGVTRCSTNTAVRNGSQDVGQGRRALTVFRTIPRASGSLAASGIHSIGSLRLAFPWHQCCCGQVANLLWVCWLCTLARGDPSTEKVAGIVLAQPVTVCHECPFVLLVLALFGAVSYRDSKFAPDLSAPQVCWSQTRSLWVPRCFFNGLRRIMRCAHQHLMH